MARAKTPETRPAERSYAERLELAAQAYRSFNAPGCGRVPSVPSTRMLSVGEPLQNIGFLTNCVVAAVQDDGQCIVVDHTKVDHNYGNPITTHNVLTGFHWTDCFRKLPAPGAESPTAVLPDLARSRVPRPDLHTRRLQGLVRSALKGDYIDDPDYQRGYVWTQSDKEAFLEAVFAGRPIGAFLFVEYPYATYQGAQVVLDGKQRLATLVEFVCSGIPFRGQYFHELSPAYREQLHETRVQVGTLDAQRVSRADLLRVFLEQNAAGVPQSEEHLTHVRELLAKEEAAESKGLA